jgi:two-component system LytT family sensor kinase
MSTWKRALIFSLAIFGIFLIVAVTFSFQGIVMAMRKGMKLGFWDVFRDEGPFWLVWAVLALPIYRFVHFLPIDGRPRRRLLLHIPGALFFTLSHLLVYLPLIYLLGDTDLRPFPPLRDFLVTLARLNYGMRVWSYFLIVAAAYAVDYYRRYQAGLTRAAQLEAHLSQAQLQALKMQLQPHFLFNTLNSISALLRKDVDAADRMIARLGDFLRLTLDNAGTQQVSFQQELDFLKSYLDIESIRFQDRFHVVFDVDPQAREVQVPNLILQPIVENAIRHGVSNMEGPARIEIRAYCADHRLRIEVQDNGPGLEQRPDGAPEIREGLGIKNTRRRLERLYGDAHLLLMSNGHDGGAVAVLEVPAGD